MQTRDRTKLRLRNGPGSAVHRFALTRSRCTASGTRGSYRPVLASEFTQPTMRDLALSMSFFEKKSSGFTLSIG
jgi:hypothetical protein